MKGKIHNLILLILSVFLLLSGCTSASALSAVSLDTQTAVTSYIGSTMFLKSDGTLWTTGMTFDGEYRVPAQLGVTVDYLRELHPFASDVAQIASGCNVNVMLKKDGSVWQWGQTNSGAFGTYTGKVTSQMTPVRMMDGVTKIYSGTGSNCFALKSNGELWGWGKNIFGAPLKTGVTLDKNTYLSGIVDGPIKIADDVKDFYMYTSFFIIKNNGSLWAWGNNEFGELGNGKHGDYDPNSLDCFEFTPVKILNSGVVKVIPADHYTLAMMQDGSLWGWGDNESGQLCNGKAGDGYKSTYDNIVLKPTKMLDSVKDVSSAGDCSAVLKSDGSLWVCGSNLYGQLGTGSMDPQTEMVKMTDGIREYCMRSRALYLLKTDGSMWFSGQITNTTKGFEETNKTSLTQIGGNIIGFGNYYAGEYVYMITQDQKLLAWGYNPFGEAQAMFSSKGMSPEDFKLAMAKQVLYNTPFEVVEGE